MNELPNDLISDNDTGNMLDDQQLLLEESVKMRFQYNGNYNVLDTLLNNHKYEEFIKIVKFIQEKMKIRANSDLTDSRLISNEDEFREDQS